jgi:hypothetical protein
VRKKISYVVSSVGKGLGSAKTLLNLLPDILTHQLRDQFKGKIHGRTRALRSNHPTIPHDWRFDQRHTGKRQGFQHTGKTGGLPSIQQSRCREYFRSRADGRRIPALLVQALEDFMNSRIRLKVISPRLATGQYDHVKIIIDHRIQGGLGQQSHAPGCLHRRIIQTGGHHIDPRPCQKICDGDSFKLFTALGKGDEDACHVFLPVNTISETGTNSMPCRARAGNSSRSTLIVAG